MIYYRYKEKDYDSLDFLLKTELSNISLPSDPSEKLLKSIGIDVIVVEDVEGISEDQLIKDKKTIRNNTIAHLTVKVNGKVFNADQTSQSRIKNAIDHLEMTGKQSKDWVMADNSICEVTVEELKEAYIKALDLQDSIWIQPYLDTEE